MARSRAQKTHQYFQPNKKDVKDDYGDCVIRSLCKATGKDWLTVFDELTPIAREEQAVHNCKQVYERYLISQGFTYTGISNKKGTKRPTVEKFAKEHKQGTYVLRVANHLVTAVDGKFYDTWDSGSCCLYGYWTKEEA